VYGEGGVGKRCRRGMWQKYYMLMCGNGKMRPVEIIPGMRGGG
jgi:hypothetical protein